MCGLRDGRCDVAEEPATYLGKTPEELGHTPRHIGIAEARGTFSAMIEAVEHKGEHYVIERHGKPAAALVSVDELERMWAARPAVEEMTGGMRLMGLLGDYMTDEEIDDMVADIYADRERNLPREIDLGDWSA